MAKKPRENRIPIMMSDDELTSVDDWRFSNKIATRSDAIRRLCQIAMAFDRAAPNLMKSTFTGAQSLKKARVAMADAFSDPSTPRVALEARSLESILAGMELFIDLAAQIGTLWSTTSLMKAPAEVTEAVELAHDIRAILEDPKLSQNQRLEKVAEYWRAIGILNPDEQSETTSD